MEAKDRRLNSRNQYKTEVEEYAEIVSHSKSIIS